MTDSLKNKYDSFDIALLALCDVTIDRLPNETLLKAFTNYAHELPHARILMYLFNGGGELKNYRVTNSEITRFVRNLMLLRNYRESNEQTTLLRNINNNLQHIFLTLNGEEEADLINIFENYSRVELLLTIRLLDNNNINSRLEAKNVHSTGEYLDKFIEINSSLFERLTLEATEAYGDEIAKNSSETLLNQLYFAKLYNVLNTIEKYGAEVNTILSDWCNANFNEIKDYGATPQYLYNYWKSVSDYRFYRLTKIFTVHELCKLCNAQDDSLFYNDKLLLELEADYSVNWRLTMPLEWQVELNGGKLEGFDENYDNDNLPALKRLRTQLLRMDLGDQARSATTVKGIVTLGTLLSTLY